MIRSDRIFGLVVILVALGYILSAVQIQTSFLSDPVGSKTFPIMIGAVAALCGLVMVVRPDPEPDWPGLGSLLAIAVSVAVLVVYAYSLKPLGFLIPTAIAAGILAFQIDPKPVRSVFIGIGLSIGLFLLFKYALDLGLVPFPKAWMK
ncbi:MAG: tripartite tricarboxylate transporter TctB family protein [Rhodobacter sp.]|nr:tripartite tricarboxylate transporter TctB family protein [Rhodobacter sp.]